MTILTRNKRLKNDVEETQKAVDQLRKQTNNFDENDLVSENINLQNQLSLLEEELQDLQVLKEQKESDNFNKVMNLNKPEEDSPTWALTADKQANRYRSQLGEVLGSKNRLERLSERNKICEIQPKKSSKKKKIEEDDKSSDLDSYKKLDRLDRLTKTF